MSEQETDKEAKNTDESGGEMTPSEGEASAAQSGAPTGIVRRVARGIRRVIFAPFVWTKKLWRRFSLKMLLFRTFVYGTTAFALIFALSIAAIKTFVSADDVKNFVKEQVETHTGGRLDIGSVTFDVLSGLTLANVQFYPPMPGDTRGFKNGGEVDPVPLANFDALDIRYSIPRIFAGRLHIKAFQLVAPEFHLKQKDGAFNFDPILAYREVHYPAEETVEETPAEEKDGSGLAINPALVFLPFDVMAQNLGIKNLRLDLIVEEQGSIKQIVVTNGLTFDLGLHWQGTKSELRFSMLSPFENPFELDVKQVPTAASDRVSQDLEQTLFLRSALNLGLVVQDLTKLSFDFATRIMRVQTSVAGYEDIGTFVKARLKVHDSLRGVDIETVQVDLAEALALGLSGSVAGKDQEFKELQLKLKMSQTLDLDAVTVLAKPFVPGLKAQGDIEIEALSIEGDLNPEKVMDPVDPTPLPFVSGTVWLHDIAAEYPGTGVTMQPIGGNVSIAAGPALGGKGSQVDLSLDLKVPDLKIAQETPVGPVVAGVEELAAKLTGRFLWPDMIAPILKLNIEAEHVKSSGPKLAPVDIPLFVDVDGEGRQDLQKMSLNANVELASLLDFSATLDCQTRCQRFRIGSVVRLDSLAALHGVIFPLGATLGLQDVMPTMLSGNVDFQLTTRGTVPDPLATPPDELLRSADVKFNLQTSVSRVNADIPMKKVRLRNLDTRVMVGGSLQRQKVELNNGFESLTLDLAAPGEEKKEITVERLAFDLVVDNDIDGAIDLAALPKQLTTDVVEKLYIGRVDVPGVLPRPLADLQFETRLAQSNVEDFTLKNVKIKVPDYGVRVDGTGTARLDPSYVPKAFNVNFKTGVEHTGGETLPGGLKTSGNVLVDVTARSEDMQFALIDGNVIFEQFNVLIAEKGKDPLLEVQGMDGQIPLKQNIYIAELLKPKPLEAPKVEEKVAAQPVEVAGQAESASFLETLQEEEGLSGTASLADVFQNYFDKTENTVLKGANVVAIVDYQSIRPFYPEKKPLGIEKLVVANLELSRMEFDIELRQNWFALNQYIINFLGGKIQGDFQVAFEPNFALKPTEIIKSLSTSVHLTRLDSRKLIERLQNLQGKAGGWNLFSNPFIDATVHFKFDPKSSDMSGGIEITSIGKEQLKMILYYVDPYEQNPTITDIRGALNWGEVKHVSIPIKNGEIGMDVGVVVLKTVPVPTPKLTRFPIRQIVDNFVSQAKQPTVETSQDESKVQM